MVDQADSGTDTVVAYTSYTLPDNVQNLTVSNDFNYAVGNNLDNLITVSGAQMGRWRRRRRRAGRRQRQCNLRGRRQHRQRRDLWLACRTGGSTSGTGGGGTGGGAIGDASATSYSAPAGVTNVVLTGSSAQTVTANNAGDTITSNDSGSTIIGGTGNDTFIAGHGADILTGGGSDSFAFNYLPWNAGQITDFTPGSDVLNLKGIFSTLGYTGTNPVGDGYLKFVSDGSGDTKVIVDPQGPSTTTPITVTTLDHVAPSAIHSGDYLFA
ncbi:MAG TPA: type I secretion C-terminal target domain-containing protein [Stellaceae bacterium]|nr:type I secretion C-terminal target domain-containing protein [Stellaceae bacterium]